jgi:large subunit ribosomal protein L23
VKSTPGRDPGIGELGNTVMASDKTKTTRGPQLEPHQVIIQPLITEKGTHQSTHEHHNAYAFQVNCWATKEQIKAAVQELFNVRVDKVRTQLRLGKKRRFRFRYGRLPNWKKAIVKLHKEDKIEFF